MYYLPYVNNLLVDATKPLPEPILTYYQWSPVTITWGQFNNKYLRHQSLKWAWNLLVWNLIQISRRPNVNELSPFNIITTTKQRTEHFLRIYCIHWNEKYYPFDEIFITGCTGSCQLDNFQCSSDEKYCQVRESVIKFNDLLETVDIGVYVVHTSHVIITYSLESLSSLQQIRHNI